jgi:alginate O-acetyltransferase complex protein AlgI
MIGDILNLSELIYFFSHTFILFFIIAFVFYWLTPKNHQNKLLLAFCYLFYFSWNIKLFSLVLLSTLVDYICANQIFQSKDKLKRKRLLRLSILVNIGSLVAFKYFDFFIESFNQLSLSLGLSTSLPILNIILPLGISFYTFQSLAYTVDVYRKKVEPEKSFINFSIFVAYFPQLIAGPIERSENLLPQIRKQKLFKEVEIEKGLFLFWFGFFKKRVIADYLAIYVERAYENPNANSLEITLGIIAFSFQAYCDVSGYTYMARGMSLLFGIKLSNNFFFPFFSKSPSDFWNRWHITLSHWLRDYVYFPILIKYRKPTLATFMTFIFVGAWHGPKFHFIEWGVLWAMIISIYHYSKIKVDMYNITILKKDSTTTILMFITIILSQGFYRAESTTHFITLLKNIFIGFQASNDMALLLNPFLILVLFIVIYDSTAYYIMKRNEFFILELSFVKKTFFYLTLYFMYRNFQNIGKLDFIYFNY